MAAQDGINKVSAEAILSLVHTYSSAWFARATGKMQRSPRILYRAACIGVGNWPAGPGPIRDRTHLSIPQEHSYIANTLNTKGSLPPTVCQGKA